MHLVQAFGMTNTYTKESYTHNILLSPVQIFLYAQAWFGLLFYTVGILFSIH